MPAADKKVLIIAYYWPPSGGSGVQRWLKFVKYLPAFGWTPTVFTPENPSASIQDPSLLNDVPPEAEVLHFPIWEPYAIADKLTGKQGESLKPYVRKKSIAKQFATWVRANLIIPDPRIFWVRPAVNFLKDYVRDRGIHIIITTGPPHSLHLIGLRLKKKNRHLKWLADFRDPWSEWGFLDSLRVSTFARGMHKRLEQQVLRHADALITITPFYQRQFAHLSGRAVHLFHNGFDHEDFKDFNLHLTERFIVRHVGTINEKCDPSPFMRALEELLLENDDLRQSIQVDYVGLVYPEFKAFTNNLPILSNKTTFTQPVPHTQLISLYEQSSLLLLVLTGYKDAEGYMPGKLFEYLATGIPVLNIGPEEGDAAKLIREAMAGTTCSDDDTDAIKTYITTCFQAWREGTQIRSRGDVMRFSRKEITRELSVMLDAMSG